MEKLKGFINSVIEKLPVPEKHRKQAAIIGGTAIVLSLVLVISLVFFSGPKKYVDMSYYTEQLEEKANMEPKLSNMTTAEKLVLDKHIRETVTFVVNLMKEIGTEGNLNDTNLRGIAIAGLVDDEGYNTFILQFDFDEDISGYDMVRVFVDSNPKLEGKFKYTINQVVGRFNDPDFDKDLIKVKTYL